MSFPLLLVLPFCSFLSPPLSHSFSNTTFSSLCWFLSFFFSSITAPSLNRKWLPLCIMQHWFLLHGYKKRGGWWRQQTDQRLLKFGFSFKLSPHSLGFYSGPGFFNETGSKNKAPDSVLSHKPPIKSTHLAVLKATDGSGSAVSEFDVKNRNVSSAAQFPAGQSVTMAFPQVRHPAFQASIPGRASPTWPGKQPIKKSFLSAPQSCYSSS